MKKNSLEIIPKQTERITNLPKGIFGDIYIAYIPGDSYNNVVSASKYVIDKGYRPVPHVPARNILNEEELDIYLSKLLEIGVTKLLIIGGSGKKIGFFEDRANDLNSKFRLPHDVPIYFHECETANAFYNGGEKYIVFCYELVEEIHSIMEKNHWSGDSAYATLGVVDWILFHEVGHALIDIHNLPITGLEEDSADQFATYQFLNDDSELPIIHTAFFWWYIQSNNYSDAAYADTHSLDVQRFYNLACWSQGKEDAGTWDIYVRINE